MIFRSPETVKSNPTRLPAARGRRRRWTIALLVILPVPAIPQVEPIAPTSLDECTVLEQQLEQRAAELDAQAKAIHDQLYRSCADLRDVDAAVQCWKRTNSGTYREDTQCGSILYNFPQERGPRFQATCAYMQARTATQSCRNKVSDYIARRSAQQQAAAAANRKSSQFDSPSGQALPAPIVPSMPVTPSEGAVSFQHGADSAARGNNIERAQMAAAATRSWKPPAELRVTESHTTNRSSLQDPFASAPDKVLDDHNNNRVSASGVDVGKWIDEGIIGALKNEAGILDSTSLKLGAESVEISETALAEWQHMRAMNEGTATAKDQVDFAAEPIKQTVDTGSTIFEMQGRPVFAPMTGLSAARKGLEGILEFVDSVAGTSQTQNLFSTDPTATRGAYDPACDMRRFGLNMLAPFIGGLKVNPEGCPSH